MYALQDYIGEDVLDAALAKFIARRVQGAPVPRRTRVRRRAPRGDAAGVPPPHRGPVRDHHALREPRDERHIREAARRKYDVAIDVHAKKIRASDLGAETEIPLDDFIDVGVLDKDGKVLALERERSRRRCELHAGVDAEPAKAGIDPLNKLIDRMPDDNVMRVEKRD